MKGVSFRRARAALVALLVTLSPLPLWTLVGTAGAAAPATVTASDEVFPQFGVSPGHSFTPNVTGRGFNDSLVKWKLAVSPSSGGTVVADFASDVALNNTTGKPDVLGVVMGLPGSVRIVAGNNGTPMWSYPLLSDVFATPIAADVNLDGRMDLVIRGDNGLLEAVSPNITWDGSNYLFPVANATDIQAQQLWNRSLQGAFSTNNNLSTPIAVDLLGNAAPEILAPAGDRLYLISGSDGTEIRNQTVDGTIVSAPTAFRVSGAWRVLVASTNRTTANFSTVASDYIVTAFDASLNFLWNASFPQSYATAPAYKSLDLQLPSPAAGNLDGAGPADDWALVTPYENSLAQLRIFHNGSNTFSVNATLQGLTGASPAVTDLDGDGVDEVVTLSYEPGTPIVSPNSRAFIEVFNGNGTLRWNATIDEVPGNTRENTLAPPAIADINGDGVKDVIVLLTDGSSEVRSGTNGSRILRHLVFDQATPTEFEGPAVADLDRDGFLDITDNAAAVSFAIAELNLNATDIGVNNTVPDQFENVSATATVHNTGNANARNVTVDFSDGGSPLNSTVLPFIAAGASALAQVVVNFSAGGLRTLRVVVDANNTVPELDETNNTASITVNVTSLFGFRLESPLNRTAVQPGYSFAFVLNTVSEGTQTNLVRLSVPTLPLNWSASLNPANVTVTPSGTTGDTNTSFVTVNTDAYAATGTYDILVHAASANSSRNAADFTFTVIIGGQFGVSLYTPSAAENVTAGDTATFAVDVLNTGNTDDTFAITNTTPPAGWSVVLSRSQMGIQAGHNATLFVLVSAPGGAAAGDQAAVNVTARSTGDTSKSDTLATVTTVVVPDLIVQDIRFFRACAGESVAGTPRLIQGEASQVLVRVANIAQNAPISVVHVRVWVDGVALAPDPTTTIGADGTGTLAPITARFSSPGAHTVAATVDPTNSVAEVSEANNDLSAQATVKDPTPVGPLSVTGYVLRGGAGVGGAVVTLTDVSTGANLSENATSSGSYSLLLPAASFSDGDKLWINATDGLDSGSVAACAYSEDGLLEANVTLALPSPYDFLLIPAGPTNLTVLPGTAATFDVTVLNRGPLNNTVLLSAASPWPVRLLDASGSVVNLVALAPNGTAQLHVEVTAPSGAAPDVSAATTLNGTAAADPSRARSLVLNATVGVLHNITLAEDAAGASLLAGDAATLNLTVANLGNADEDVALDDACAGPSACSGWTALSLRALTVPAGGSAVVLATVRTAVGAVGGAYLINITASAPAGNVSTQATVSFNLSVTEKRFAFTVSGGFLRVVPGATRSANITVTNRGTVPDTYNVSTVPQGAGYTVNLLPGGGLAVSFALNAGESRAVEVELTAPREVDRESFDIPVTVASSALSDAGDPNAVAEATLRADVGPIFDFRITGPTLSGDPVVDEEVQVFATVGNNGARSFAGTLTVRLKVDDVTIDSQVISSLDAGREESIVFRWTPHIAGEVNLTVDVNGDPGSSIYESSFANNAGTRTVAVAPPKAPGLLANRAVQLAFLAIVVVLILVAAFARKQADEQPPVDAEKAREESDDRRMGKGPGGLGRL